MNFINRVEYINCCNRSIYNKTDASEVHTVFIKGSNFNEKRTHARLKNNNLFSHITSFACRRSSTTFLYNQFYNSLSLKLRVNPPILAIKFWVKLAVRNKIFEKATKKEKLRRYWDFNFQKHTQIFQECVLQKWRAISRLVPQ